jgi:hypothetical protein
MQKTLRAIRSFFTFWLSPVDREDDYYERELKTY